MGRRSQAETVQSISDGALILNLYFTQLLLALAVLVLWWLLGDHWISFLQLFHWDPISIITYGGGLAAFSLSIDWLLTKTLPERLYDDGGINKRIFSILSIPHILWITIVIAVVEETLFRGILQEHFGLIVSSLIFAGLHVRYLSKLALFLVVTGMSFLLGLSFLFTHNLLIVIFAHFCIDFVLGVSIRMNDRS